MVIKNKIQKSSNHFYEHHTDIYYKFLKIILTSLTSMLFTEKLKEHKTFNALFFEVTTVVILSSKKKQSKLVQMTDLKGRNLILCLANLFCG